MKLPQLSKIQIAIAVAILSVVAYFLIFQPFRFVRYQGLPFLSYNDLVSLCKKGPNPGGILEWKMKRIFSTPLISNEAYYKGVRPRKLKDSKLGPEIRLAQWNIEKSIDLDDAITAFANPEKFKTLIDTKKFPETSEEYKKVREQRDRLAGADILVLQEMDIGVKRSKYRNAPGDLAKALGMNYAYGVMQLEIDPVNLGMKEEFTYEDGKVDEKLYDLFKVDRSKYKGCFGLAVLSRYPIKHVQVFQLKNEAYDWYYQEKQKTSFLEKVRREASKDIFLEKLMREMKVGGRMFMRVDLEVPELPGKTLTIINVHLEIKCKPQLRTVQMQEILGYIDEIKNPVIMTGDFNSSASDLSPTSVKRELRKVATNPTFWFSQAVTLLVPYGFFINVGRFVANFAKNNQDPTAANIPIILPNKQRPLFDAIENYHFGDGKTFDFRGNSNRSTNQKNDALANSNERDAVGFKTSFKTERSFFTASGKYRLDWIFVKPIDLKNSKDNTASYRFAPHFAATLEELNTGLKQNISDHAPSVVELPLEEPKL